MLIGCGIALKKVPLTPSIVNSSLREKCNPCTSLTAGSAKLQDWLIREAVRPWINNKRGSIRNAIGNGDPMKRVNYLIHYTLCMKTERWKEE